MSRRPTRRDLVGLAATLAALSLAACTAGSDEPSTTTVGGVSLAVPDGWEEQVVEPDDESLVAVSRFSPGDRPTTRLQVIVGCGEESADELVTGAAARPRDDLVAVEADDAVEASVPGTDTARRTTMSFGEQTTGTASLRVGGLYASSGDGLLLVELIAAPARYDEQLARQILDSVEVAADELEAACSDT